MIKKLAALLFLSTVAHAFSPVRYVQISTNSLTQQTGQFNVAGGTVAVLFASTATISSATLTTAIINGGSINNQSVITSTISASSATLTNVTATTGTFTNMSISSMTSTLPMSGRKITGLANGTAITDAAAFGQLFNVICSSTVAISSSTTSGTFVPTNLSCSGSLGVSGHHALILASGDMKTTVAGAQSIAALFIDSTNLDDPSQGQCTLDANATGFSLDISHCTMIGYTLPGDTNSHTYAVKFFGAGGTAIWGNGATTRMVVIETN